MSTVPPTNPGTANSSAPTREINAEVRLLAEKLRSADAVLVGAGAGLSAAAGLDVGGDRFASLFSDFARRYGLTDAYSGGFYLFPTPEERWGFWARNILVSYYDLDPLPAFQQLHEVLAGVPHFVLTTNVDDLFVANGWDADDVFATQGSYGEFQCYVPCRQETWSNEEAVRQMVASTRDCRIPTELIPRCPWCGAPATTHLRIDDHFVQPDSWYDAAERYQQFMDAHTDDAIVYLELGVGWNTPGIIKYPMWQRTYQNPNAHYATISLEPHVPAEIADQSQAITADCATVISQLAQQML